MFKSPQTSVSLRVLHLSFMPAVLIYGLVAYLLKSQVMLDEPGFVGLDDATYTVLLYGVIGVSVVLAVVALGILPQLDMQARIMPKLTVRGEDTPQARQQTYHILRVAVIEAIAIFGLLLFLLNGNLTHLWWFLGGALALLVVIFPQDT